MIIHTTLNDSQLTLALPAISAEAQQRLARALQQTTKELIMKVRFKNNILSYSGRVDNLVFYWNTRLQRTVCRTYTKGRVTGNNTRFGLVAKT